MSAPHVIIITEGTLVLADSQVALDSGEAYECQTTEAAINATPNLQTVPATFCEPESQSPAATGFELEVTWLQDWSASGGGLSKYAFDNDTETKWFRLMLDTGVTVAEGQCRIVAGSFGGAAGTPLTATTTWPLASKPDIIVPTDVSSAHPTAAAFADLPTLKADGTEGDGMYSGAAFLEGEYITLVDLSICHYASAVWTAGATPPAP